MLELIDKVTIDECTLPGCMSMQIQECKEPTLLMNVCDQLLTGIDGAVFLRRGVNVVSIKVSAIGIGSIVSSGHPIWVEYREYVKHKVVQEELCYNTLLLS